MVFVTGAGISAQSGIPTFRGKDGYWTVGSREYHPQEMATFAAFSEMPREVWRWYLYRRTVCRGANPNPGHVALVEFEAELGNGFSLLTQNVDGLHLRAGQSQERTYEIHGNVDYMRCAVECSVDRFEIPRDILPYDRSTPLADEDYEKLRCPRCGAHARPHVLWFDECYDEERYRFESSLARANEASIVITVGTTGSTNLPNLVVQRASANRVPIIDINPCENVFSQVAERTGGVWLAGSADEVLPSLLS